MGKRRKKKEENWSYFHEFFNILDLKTPKNPRESNTQRSHHLHLQQFHSSALQTPPAFHTLPSNPPPAHYKNWLSKMTLKNDFQRSLQVLIQVPLFRKALRLLSTSIFPPAAVLPPTCAWWSTFLWPSPLGSSPSAWWRGARGDWSACEVFFYFTIKQSVWVVVFRIENVIRYFENGNIMILSTSNGNRRFSPFKRADHISFSILQAPLFFWNPSPSSSLKNPEKNFLPGWAKANAFDLLVLRDVFAALEPIDSHLTIFRQLKDPTNEVGLGD